MSEIIKQYGETIIAMIGSVCFLGIMSAIFLSHDGLLAQMIVMWGNGGC